MSEVPLYLGLQLGQDEYHFPKKTVPQKKIFAPRSHARPFAPYRSVVLGAIVSFLEPFCEHLSPEIDKVSET